MGKLSAIKVCIWDFDGTLYRLPETLADDFRRSWYQVMATHTGWDTDKITEEFEKVYHKITPSATEAVGIVCGISTPQAAVEIENGVDRNQYLSHDDRLVALFDSLSGYRHFIFGNGSAVHIRAALDALGVSPAKFEEIVTSEIVGVNKPHDKGFLYIIGKTGLPASAHLMIGDREHVDLEPAKRVGMKTCLVGALKPSMIADATVAHVYDIAKLLG